MRPINVTLDSHTWELAKRKKNFSGWVRKQLEDEEKRREKAQDDRQMYGAFCKACDFHFNHPEDFMMKEYRCKFCNAQTIYCGAV